MAVMGLDQDGEKKQSVGSGVLAGMREDFAKDRAGFDPECGGCVADQSQTNKNISEPEALVSPDQEVWVKQRILTAITASLFVAYAQKVRADQDIVMSAIDGIANGTAVEIIHTLGRETAYVNLRRPHDHRFVPTRYDISLWRILTLRDSRVEEETCKDCGEKRYPQQGD